MNHLSKYIATGLIFITSVAVGQEEFAELSSKKRISIAQQEETDAKNDAAFQAMMVSGHDLFKGKHYLKAIRKYEEAQSKRPYNVYPKVIISDIELSMKDTLETLRNVEHLNKQQLPEVKQEEVQPEKISPPPSTVDQIEKMNQWEAEERKRRQEERDRANRTPEPTTPQNNGEVVVLSMEDFQKDLAVKYPSGLTETVETEGNRTVTTRIIVSEGKGNEYKKVVHNWGGVFYFKNGEAVTERVWKQETEK